MLDHRINEVDLALGFEFKENPKYYRFPLWVYHNEFISPNASLEDIRTLLEQINDPSTRRGTGRSRFIGQISSHDKGGMRGRLIDLLSPIGQIDCAGKFRHNTDELLEVYGDDKFKFLPTTASTSAQRICSAKATSQRRSSTAYARGVSPSIGVLT
jgi:LPS biosynthesis related glycosyltransferase